MAVVVSQSQNEIEEFKKKGLDIATHRKRMVKEDLEKRFKKSDDPLRIVFVCAMWITGFDVPSCSTIYLDKPMKNHTLDADHRTGKPGVERETERADRGLRRNLP